MSSSIYTTSCQIAENAASKEFVVNVHQVVLKCVRDALPSSSSASSGSGNSILAFDENTVLAECGLDSLASLSIRNHLIELFHITNAVEVPGNIILQCPTALAISNWFGAFMRAHNKNAIFSAAVASSASSIEAMLNEEEDDSSPANTNATHKGPGVESIVPASCMQQGMLFHGLMNAQSRSFVETFVWKVSTCRASSFDIQAFRVAWSRLLARHAILRASFDPVATPAATQSIWSIDHVFQLPHINAVCDYHVAQAQSLTAHCGDGMWFTVVDCTATAPAGKVDITKQIVKSQREKGFDVSCPVLFNLVVVVLPDRSINVVFTGHHCLLDGWSIRLMLQQLSEEYSQIMHDVGEEKNTVYKPVVSRVSSYERFAKYEHKLLKSNLHTSFPPSKLLIRTKVRVRALRSVCVNILVIQPHLLLFLTILPSLLYLPATFPDLNLNLNLHLHLHLHLRLHLHLHLRLRRFRWSTTGKNS